jgi:hypothetical protein
VIRGISWFPTKEGWTELGGCEISTVRWECTVIAAFPSANAALGLCVFSEDEAEGYVQAAHGKEEKCGDEREFANVVGEDRCPDAKEGKSIRIRAQFRRARQRRKETTYSAWKIPSGPRPN